MRLRLSWVFSPCLCPILRLLITLGRQLRRVLGGRRGQYSVMG